MTDYSDIEEITLSDMSLKVDVEKLLTEDFPGRQQLLALLLVQVNYKRIMSLIGDTEKKYYHDRALGQAKFFAIQQLPALENSTHGALLFLVNEAQNTGWYTSDYYGYADVEDLLSNTWEEAEEGSSIKSDFSFIVQKLIPAAKEMGIRPGQLIAAHTQTKKLRQIVPTARTILSSNASIEDKREGIEWLIGMVADKNFSVREVASQVNTYRGKHSPIPSSLEGNIFIVPGGKSWIVIECADKVEERAVQQALHSHVEIELADLSTLFLKVANMLKVNREVTTGDSRLARMLQNLEEVK